MPNPSSIKEFTSSTSIMINRAGMRIRDQRSTPLETPPKTTATVRPMKIRCQKRFAPADACRLPKTEATLSGPNPASCPLMESQV